jgi:hypothetical protein
LLAPHSTTRIFALTTSTPFYLVPTQFPTRAIDCRRCHPLRHSPSSLLTCLLIYAVCLFVCLGSRARRCWTHCRPSREVSWSPSNARCFPHQSRHHSLPRAADVKSLSRTRTHVTATTRCSPQETEPVLCFLATAAREREVNITRNHVPPWRSCCHSHARHSHFYSCTLCHSRQNRSLHEARLFVSSLRRNHRLFARRRTITHTHTHTHTHTLTHTHTHRAITHTCSIIYMVRKLHVCVRVYIKCLHVLWR